MENGLLNALKRLLGCFPCIPSSGAQPDVPDHRSTPSLSAPGQENSKIILDAESDEEEDDGEAWGSWETQGKGEAREGTAMQSGAGKSPKDELSATSISREQAEEELKATMASFNLNKTNTTPRSTDSSPKKTKASSGDGPVNEEDLFNALGMQPTKFATKRVDPGKGEGGAPSGSKFYLGDEDGETEGWGE